MDKSQINYAERNQTKKKKILYMVLLILKLQKMKTNLQ